MKSKKTNLNHSKSIQTQIVDQLEEAGALQSVFPHCTLHKFANADLKAACQGRRRTLLSVSTWDGRNIFEVGVPDSN